MLKQLKQKRLVLRQGSDILNRWGFIHASLLKPIVL